MANAYKLEYMYMHIYAYVSSQASDRPTASRCSLARICLFVTPPRAGRRSRLLRGAIVSIVNLHTKTVISCPPLSVKQSHTLQDTNRTFCSWVTFGW